MYVYSIFILFYTYSSLSFPNFSYTRSITVSYIDKSNIIFMISYTCMITFNLYFILSSYRAVMHCTYHHHWTLVKSIYEINLGKNIHAFKCVAQTQKFLPLIYQWHSNPFNTFIIPFVQPNLFLITFLNIRETVVYGRKRWNMRWTSKTGKKFVKHSRSISK